MINGKIIKVCGMREGDNIQELDILGKIDMMGFIFYPKSPRCVYELPSHLPVQTHRVGVFVNEKKQAVMTYADRFGLDYVQLHGNESPEYCRSLHSTGIKIIKAFAIAHVHDLQQTIHYEKFCEYFLFDTLSGQYGGSGRCFDWKILQAYNRDIPFILSGGIGPKSVQALSKFHHPCLAGYDINSHFELSPGEKDTERIQRFLDKLTIQFSL